MSFTYVIKWIHAYIFVLLYGSKMKGDTKFSPESIMRHVYKCKPVQVFKGEIAMANVFL